MNFIVWSLICSLLVYLPRDSWSRHTSLRVMIILASVLCAAAWEATKEMYIPNPFVTFWSTFKACAVILNIGNIVKILILFTDSHFSEFWSPSEFGKWGKIDHGVVWFWFEFSRVAGCLVELSMGHMWWEWWRVEDNRRRNRYQTNATSYTKKKEKIVYSLQREKFIVSFCRKARCDDESFTITYTWDWLL